MPYFKDADEVYANIGRLFEDVTNDPELGPRFQQANIIARYQYSDPESQITIKLREGEDMQVDLGESDLEPDVVMTMEADTGHKFWLGKVRASAALARGQIKAEGEVMKMMKFMPLTQQVIPRYKKQLEEAGRQDLLEV